MKFETIFLLNLNVLHLKWRTGRLEIKCVDNLNRSRITTRIIFHVILYIKDKAMFKKSRYEIQSSLDGSKLWALFYKPESLVKIAFSDIDLNLFAFAL